MLILYIARAQQTVRLLLGGRVQMGLYDRGHVALG